MPPRFRNSTGYNYHGQGGASPSDPPLATVTGAGKKNSQLKNRIYSKPLPVDLDGSSLASSSSSSSSSSLSILNPLNHIVRFLAHSHPFYQAKGKQRAASQPEIAQAFYDKATHTVWVVDMEQGKRLLWQRGFFGKGILSRSEPTWKQRREGEIDAMRRGVLTAEQLTQRRRDERKALKIERARAAVRAGQQLPDGIVALGGEITEEDRLVGSRGHERMMKDIERQVEEQMKAEEEEEGQEGQEGQEGALWRGDEQVPDIVPGQARIKGLKYFTEEAKATAAAKAEREARMERERMEESFAGEINQDGEIVVVDMERMQLSLVETFFLSGMLACLEVREDSGEGRVLSIRELYSLCLTSVLPDPLQALSSNSLAQRHLNTLAARPDNPFLINYVAYHHFRSLGWVVKTGLKFCVDYLLYKRGPVFSHAEFAVLVLPSYEDPEDEESSPFLPHSNKGDKSWIWFSTFNRVNTQVLKTLILAHVFVPSIKRIGSERLESPESFVEDLKEGKSFAIKEVAIRRWSPARMKP
ncbi:hypothetical protein IE53DRAFT_407247 [Violaceomyces palustris]|uniref:Uncharacterized protein n=1 Tax=Violaceomyces palustris TaxID=1673888 RepID=A0ACD0NQL9_9BASI|nr:hypothetical protein IE53DRAFT_407247 [Violaceomyces palustris]